MAASLTRPDGGKTSLERSFLPAALELQRTPPSPVGRALLWVIVALLVTGVSWASWAHIDIVAVARGRIIPSGHVKVVQAFEHGTVRAILVAEGEQVTAGQLLIELDDTEAAAALRQVEVELANLIAERQRYQALSETIHVLRDPSSDGPHNQTDRTAGAATSRASLEQSDLDELIARLDELDAERTRKRAELATAESQIHRLSATLPLVTRRAEALHRLDREKLGSTQAWLELEQERIGLSEAIEVEKARKAQILAGVAVLDKNREVLLTERQRLAEERSAEINRRLALLGEQRLQAESRLTRSRIVAPATGTVQQLAIHTEGGVVAPAQELLRIVPSGDRLDVEASVLNRDIGHVATGMEAEIKFDAYPFTRYGTRQATLASIARDATFTEALGAIYKTQLIMHHAVDGSLGPTEIAPGMTVSVEIKTGQRRVIEFLLSPLLKALEEAGRER